MHQYARHSIVVCIINATVAAAAARLAYTSTRQRYSQRQLGSDNNHSQDAQQLRREMYRSRQIYAGEKRQPPIEISTTDEIEAGCRAASVRQCRSRHWPGGSDVSQRRRRRLPADAKGSRGRSYGSHADSVKFISSDV